MVKRTAPSTLSISSWRRLVVCPRFGRLSHLFVFLTSAWMIGSRLQEDGLHPSAVAEVIELFGGYVVSRACFFGRPALQEFTQVFKILTATLILLACLEPLAGRNVVTAMTSMLFHTPEFYPQYRYGIVRAQSTLEDAEHFGTFCCVAASLLLYSEFSGVRFATIGLTIHFWNATWMLWGSIAWHTCLDQGISNLCRKSPASLRPSFWMMPQR